MRPIYRVAIIAWVFGTAAAACGRNWDDYDPRLGDGPATGSGGDVGGNGGAGGGGDAGGGGGGGGGLTLCGGVGVLANDFDDGLDNPLMEGTGVEANGQLTIPVPAGDDYGYYVSRAAYVLDGRSVSLELVGVPPDAGFYFSLDSESDDWLEFVIEDGTLRSRRCLNAGESCSAAASAAFDETAHRFVQLREDGGTVYFEVSTDGADWEPFGSAPVLGMGELLTLNIGFYDSSPSPLPRQIVVDNLAAAAEAHCPANFEDDFDDGIADPRWTIGWLDPGVDLDEADGVFEVFVDAGAHDESGTIETKAAFDIRGAVITVEIVQGVGAGEPGQVWFILGSLDEDNAVIFNPNVDTLYLIELVDGNWDAMSVPYDPQTMRWLRFREADGKIHFETAADNNSDSFTTVHSATPLFDITATKLLLGGGASAVASGGLSSPHVLQLDHFSARIP